MPEWAGLSPAASHPRELADLEAIAIEAGNTKTWDYAAGALIAAEAGARLRLPSGSDGQLMVAASEAVFAPLVALLD